MLNSSETNDNSALLRLVRKSLSWEYMGGGRFNRSCHPPTDWRLMPCLVIVCPVESDYVSEIEHVGVLNVKPGEALLVPKGVRHTVAMPKLGVVHYAHIQFTIFDSLDVLEFFDVPFVVAGDAARQISQLTTDFFEMMEHHPGNNQMITQAIEQQALGSHLLELIMSESKLRERADYRLESIHRLEPVLRYVEENLARPISRCELADIAVLSETRFHYVFKEIMGVSPIAYVRNVRIQKAQFLLIQTSLGIAEIGERVGYPDIFHFSKTFKMVTGMSPMRYRENSLQCLVYKQNRT